MRASVLSLLLVVSAGACSMAEPADAPAPSTAGASSPTEPVLTGEPSGHRPDPGAQADQPPCPVLVRFGSFAMGIDQAAYSAVTEALKADGRVASVTERPWGREGERDLCVTPRNPGDAGALVKVARDVVPAGPLRGPVEIQLGGKTVFPAKAAPG